MGVQPGDIFPPAPYNWGNGDGTAIAGQDDILRGGVGSLLLSTPCGTVEKALFSFTCTTCQARLAVHDESSIGAILACPKCGSMVQVVPPVGWTAGEQEAPQPDDSAGADASGALSRAEGGTSPAELLWRKRLILAGAAAATLVLGIGLVSLFTSSGSSQSPSSAEAQHSDEPSPDAPSTPDEEQPKPHQPPPSVDNDAPQPEQPPATVEGDDRAPVSQPPDGPLEPTPTSGAGDQTSLSPPGPEVKPTPPGPEPLAPEPESPKSEQPPPEPSEPEEPEETPETPPQSAPAKVDVAARLADTVPQVDLRDMPLVKAIDLLADLSTLPISFDPEALLQRGVTLRDPIRVQLSGATIGEILEAIAASRGLAVVVENGQVLISGSPSQRETLRRMRYTVSDLAGTKPEAVGQLAALVGKLVAPGSWHGAGGRGTVEADGGALAVEQTGAVHHQILVFCEKLRNARGKPLRSRYDPAWFKLATRWQQAQEMLARQVTINFYEPTPLADIVGYLEEVAGGHILIDRPALGAAGLSARTPARLTVEKKPLGAAIDELLKPLGLAYRVVAADTLEVTTPKATGTRLEVEFYPVKNLLVQGQTSAALTARLKRGLPDAAWSGDGGRGVMHFDEPSGYLIVLQSQPVHRAIERLLSAGPGS